MGVLTGSRRRPRIRPREIRVESGKDGRKSFAGRGEDERTERRHDRQMGEEMVQSRRGGQKGARNSVEEDQEDSRRFGRVAGRGFGDGDDSEDGEGHKIEGTEKESCEGRGGNGWVNTRGQNILNHLIFVREAYLPNLRPQINFD